VLTLKGQVWCSQTHRDRADGGGVREDNSCRSEKLGFAASYFVNLGRLESAEFPNRIAVDELDCRPNYSCTISAIPEPFAPHVGARHVLARSHSQGVTRDRQARVAGLQGCRVADWARRFALHVQRKRRREIPGMPWRSCFARPGLENCAFSSSFRTQEPARQVEAKEKSNHHTRSHGHHR
jgi:hypothetical protein